MRGVLEGVQPELEPDHSHAQAHRVQAVLVWALREGLPAQGGPAPAPRLAARRARRGPARAAARAPAAPPAPLHLLRRTLHTPH